MRKATSTEIKVQCALSLRNTREMCRRPITVQLPKSRDRELVPRLMEKDGCLRSKDQRRRAPLGLAGRRASRGLEFCAHSRDSLPQRGERRLLTTAGRNRRRQARVPSRGRTGWQQRGQKCEGERAVSLSGSSGLALERRCLQTMPTAGRRQRGEPGQGTRCHFLKLHVSLQLSLN